MFDPNLYNNYYSRAAMQYGQGVGNYLATGFDPMMLPNLGLMERGSYYGNGPPVPLATTVASFFTGGGALPINHQPINRAIEATAQGRRYMQGRGQFLTNQSINQMRSIFTSINNQRGLADTGRGFRTIENMLRSPIGQMMLPMAYGMAPDQFEGIFGRAGSGIGMYDAAYNAATYRRRDDGTRWTSDQYLQFAERAADRFYGSPEARAERMINSHQGGQLYTYLDRAGFLGAKNEYGDRKYTPRVTGEELTSQELINAVKDYSLSNPIAANAPSSVKVMHQRLNQRQQVNDARRRVRNAAALIADGPKGPNDKVYEQNLAEYMQGLESLQRVEKDAGIKSGNVGATDKDTTKMSQLSDTFKTLQNLKAGDDPLTSTRRGNEEVANAMNLITELGIEQIEGSQQNFDVNTMRRDQLGNVSSTLQYVSGLMEKQKEITDKKKAFADVGSRGMNIEYGSFLDEKYKNAISNSLREADKQRAVNSVRETLDRLDYSKMTEAEFARTHEELKQQYGGEAGQQNYGAALSDTELGVLIASRDKQLGAGGGTGYEHLLKNATAGKTSSKALLSFLDQINANLYENSLTDQQVSQGAEINRELGKHGLRQKTDLDLDTLSLDGMVDMGEAMLALQSDPALQEWIRISGMLKQGESAFTKMEKAVASVRSSLAVTGKSMEETVGILNEFTGGNLIGANLDTLAPTVRQTFLAAKELNMSDDQVVQHMSRSAQMNRAMGINSGLNPALGYTDLNIRSGMSNTALAPGGWGMVSNETAAEGLSQAMRTFLKTDPGNSLAAMMRIADDYQNGDDAQKKRYEGSRLAKHLEAVRSGKESYEYVDEKGVTRRAPVVASKQDALTMMHELTGDWSVGSAYLEARDLNQKSWADHPERVLLDYQHTATQNIGNRFTDSMNLYANTSMLHDLGLSKEEQAVSSTLIRGTLKRASVDMFNGQRLKEIDPLGKMSRPEQLSEMFSRQLDNDISRLEDAKQGLDPNSTEYKTLTTQQNTARALRKKFDDGGFRNSFGQKAYEKMSEQTRIETGLDVPQAMQQLNVQVGYDVMSQKVSQQVQAQQEAGLTGVLGETMSERLVSVLTRNSSNYGRTVAQKKQELRAQGVAEDKLDTAAENAATAELRKGVTTKDMIQALFGLNSQFDPSGSSTSNKRLNTAYNAMQTAGNQVVQLESEIEQTKRRQTSTPQEEAKQKADLKTLEEQRDAAKDWYEKKIENFKTEIQPLANNMQAQEAGKLGNMLGGNAQMVQGVWMQERVGNRMVYRMSDPMEVRHHRDANSRTTGRLEVRKQDGNFGFMAGGNQPNGDNDALTGFITLADSDDPNNPASQTSTMHQIRWDSSGAYYTDTNNRRHAVDFNSPDQAGLLAVGTKLLGAGDSNATARYALAGKTIVQRQENGTWAALRDREGNVVSTDSRIGKQLIASASLNRELNAGYVNRIVNDSLLDVEKKELNTAVNFVEDPGEIEEAKAIANRSRGTSEIEAQVDRHTFNENGVDVSFYAVRGVTTPSEARLGEAEKDVKEFYTTKDENRREELIKKHPTFLSAAMVARRDKYQEYQKTIQTLRTQQNGLNKNSDAYRNIEADIKELSRQSFALQSGDVNKLAADLTTVDQFREKQADLMPEIEKYLGAGEAEATKMLAESPMLKGIGGIENSRETYRTVSGRILSATSARKRILEEFESANTDYKVNDNDQVVDKSGQVHADKTTELQDKLVREGALNERIKRLETDRAAVVYRSSAVGAEKDFLKEGGKKLHDVATAEIPLSIADDKDAREALAAASDKGITADDESLKTTTQASAVKAKQTLQARLEKAEVKHKELDVSKEPEEFAKSNAEITELRRQVAALDRVGEQSVISRGLKQDFLSAFVENRGVDVTKLKMSTSGEQKKTVMAGTMSLGESGETLSVLQNGIEVDPKRINRPGVFGQLNADDDARLIIASRNAGAATAGELGNLGLTTGSLGPNATDKERQLGLYNAFLSSIQEDKEFIAARDQYLQDPSETNRTKFENRIQQLAQKKMSGNEVGIIDQGESRQVKTNEFVQGLGFAGNSFKDNKGEFNVTGKQLTQDIAKHLITGTESAQAAGRGAAKGERGENIQVVNKRTQVGLPSNDVGEGGSGIVQTGENKPSQIDELAARGLDPALSAEIKKGVGEFMDNAYSEYSEYAVLGTGRQEVLFQDINSGLAKNNQRNLSADKLGKKVMRELAYARELRKRAYDLEFTDPEKSKQLMAASDSALARAIKATPENADEKTSLKGLKTDEVVLDYRDKLDRDERSKKLTTDTLQGSQSLRGTDRMFSRAGEGHYYQERQEAVKNAGLSDAGELDFNSLFNNGYIGGIYKKSATATYNELVTMSQDKENYSEQDRAFFLKQAGLTMSSMSEKDREKFEINYKQWQSPGLSEEEARKQVQADKAAKVKPPEEKKRSWLGFAMDASMGGPMGAVYGTRINGTTTEQLNAEKPRTWGGFALDVATRGNPAAALGVGIGTRLSSAIFGKSEELRKPQGASEAEKPEERKRTWGEYFFGKSEPEKAADGKKPEQKKETRVEKAKREVKERAEIKKAAARSAEKVAAYDKKIKERDEARKPRSREEAAATQLQLAKDYDDRLKEQKGLKPPPTQAERLARAARYVKEKDRQALRNFGMKPADTKPAEAGEKSLRSGTTSEGEIAGGNAVVKPESVAPKTEPAAVAPTDSKVDTAGGNAVPKTDSVAPVASKEDREAELTQKMQAATSEEEYVKYQKELEALTTETAPAEAKPDEVKTDEAKTDEAKPAEAKPATAKPARAVRPKRTATKITFGNVAAPQRQRLDRWRRPQLDAALATDKVLGGGAQTAPLATPSTDLLNAPQGGATPVLSAQPADISTPPSDTKGKSKGESGKGAQISMPDSDITAENATITLRVDNLHLESSSISLEAKDLISTNASSSHLTTMNA